MDNAIKIESEPSSEMGHTEIQFSPSAAAAVATPAGFMLKGTGHMAVGTSEKTRGLFHPTAHPNHPHHHHQLELSLGQDHQHHDHHADDAGFLWRPW